MTTVLRQPSARLLGIVALATAILLGGFIWMMASVVQGITPSPSEPLPAQAMMETVSRHLDTDRSWTATESGAALMFGMAVYTVSGVDRPDPTLTIDTSHAPPDVRSRVAGRAASVALAVANAPDRPVDQVEVSRALAERREDVRVVNGVEIAVAGDRLTLRQVAG